MRTRHQKKNFDLMRPKWPSARENMMRAAYKMREPSVFQNSTPFRADLIIMISSKDLLGIPSNKKFVLPTYGKFGMRDLFGVRIENQLVSNRKDIKFWFDMMF